MVFSCVECCGFLRVVWTKVRKQAYGGEPNAKAFCGQLGRHSDICFTYSVLTYHMALNTQKIYMNDSKKQVREKLGLQSKDKDECFIAFEVYSPLFSFAIIRENRFRK